MINKSRKQRLIAEINITPFTDVVLVLLIIFMVTTPLILQSSIKVKLPQSASANPLKAPIKVNITITNENLVYLENQLVTKKELRERVKKMQEDNPDLAVVLLSDRMVQFSQVVGVLDVLNDLGIRNLNIAATKE